MSTSVAGPAAGAQSRAVARRFEWTTPRILRAAVVAVWVACPLFFVVANAAVSADRQAVQTIGRDATPSVIAAAQIRAIMADLDANLAYLLIASPTETSAVEATIGTNDTDVSSALVAAAQNITYGDQERIPIRTIVAGLDDYTQSMAEARVLHARGDDQGALAAHRTATDLMHQTLLPAAVSLGSVNQQALEDAYQAHVTTASLQQGLVILVGLLGIGALIATQVFVARRTRRVFNLPLLLATLLLAGLLLQTVNTLSESNKTLKVAKKDAFDSIVALWQARAVAFDARGDERRYLLDPTRAADTQAQFAQHAALLFDPGGRTADQAVALADGGSVQFKGYLADELNNITFDGEQAAALGMLHDFVAYLAVDSQMRALEQAGRHQDAIAMTGSQEGQTDWAFDRFDASLGKVLAINQQAFDDAIDRGFGLVGWFPIGCPIALLAVAALTLLGLWPRLEEYRH